MLDSVVAAGDDLTDLDRYEIGLALARAAELRLQDAEVVRSTIAALPQRTTVPSTRRLLVAPRKPHTWNEVIKRVEAEGLTREKRLAGEVIAATAVSDEAAGELMTQGVRCLSAERELSAAAFMTRGLRYLAGADPQRFDLELFSASSLYGMGEAIALDAAVRALLDLRRPADAGDLVEERGGSAFRVDPAGAAFLLRQCFHEGLRSACDLAVVRSAREQGTSTELVNAAYLTWIGWAVDVGRYDQTVATAASTIWREVLGIRLSLAPPASPPNGVTLSGLQSLIKAFEQAQWVPQKEAVQQAAEQWQRASADPSLTAP
jgi:hypothetical protein